jgi:hypothetical protein
VGCRHAVEECWVGVERMTSLRLALRRGGRWLPMILLALASMAVVAAPARAAAG